MNWKQELSNRKQLKGKFKDKWGGSTDDEPDQILGKPDLKSNAVDKAGETARNNDSEIEEAQRAIIEQHVHVLTKIKSQLQERMGYEESTQRSAYSDEMHEAIDEIATDISGLTISFSLPGSAVKPVKTA
jgi:uncharacterized protein YjbJ (UPF0337 family)